MRRIELKSAPLSTLLLFSMLVSLLFISFVAKSASATPNGPIHIHLTWGQNDAAHTIVVTWKTTTENAGDVVRYDTKFGGGDSDNYAYSETGSHHTYSSAGGYVHDVELTGLSPNTNYYFICGGENGGWSEEQSFRTAPETSTNIRFVAEGDARSGSGDWPLSRDSISRTMAKFNPSFVLFNGDFAYNWNLQTEWDNWFAATQEYWVDNNGLTIPIIPCIGNHEVYYPQPSNYYPETQATNYYGQFSLPGNERWYSLDWGPDLHIIVLDSEIGSRSSAWEEQLSWLEDDLATHASCRWKIAMYHEPSFTKSRHYSNSLTREGWVPLFDLYHVDLVISGHNHCYERTDPINYTESKENVMSSPAEGTIYVTAGAGGAPLYSDNRQDWWTGYGPVAKYSFVVVDIFDNGTLHLQAVGTDGETFDEYYVYKSDVGVSISPREDDGLPGENITFTVTVTNTGQMADNYDLTITDDAGWGATLGENRFENVAPGESQETTVSVTVPSGAASGASATITVTAISQTNPIVENLGTCKAAVAAGVSPWVYVGIVIVIVVIISAVLITRPF